MELIVIWLVLCAVVGLFASNKGRSGFGWFLFSVLLSPLIGIIVVAVIAPGESKAPAVVAASAAPQSVVGVADELTKLGELRDSGTISHEEFDRQRAVLLPAAPPPGLTSYGQALPGHVCGRCGKGLSPAWVGKCQHCRAAYTEFPPVPAGLDRPTDPPLDDR